MKAILKSLMALTPYRIVRDSGANRFQAIDTSLRALRDRGFKPKLIIDGGAHVGSFSQLAQTIFPLAAFHLVEPQPACQPILRRVCERHSFILHPYALSDGDGELLFRAGAELSTGAHVAATAGKNTVAVQSRKLDNLLPDPAGDSHALLKLDLQGFELHALRGAASVLRVTDVVLCEVSFFAQAYEPSIRDLVVFLHDNGFELYDIAALTARRRDNRPHQGDFIFARSGSDLTSDTAWG